MATALEEIISLCETKNKLSLTDTQKESIARFVERQSKIYPEGKTDGMFSGWIRGLSWYRMMADRAVLTGN